MIWNKQREISKVRILEKRRKSEIIAQSLLYSNFHANHNQNELSTPNNKNPRLFIAHTPKNDPNYESRGFSQKSLHLKSDKNAVTSTILESVQNESVSGKNIETIKIYCSLLKND